MTTVVVEPEVGFDLDEIEVFIGQDGPLAARRMIDRIETVIRGLSQNPRTHSVRRELAQVRLAMVKPYVIVFRYDEARDLVRVYRVVHGARDLTILLDT